jgi:tRNA modification GTPase
LLGHERAIVTPVPGTTRDVIEESASLQGIPFILSDTAGLRYTEDLVEKIGVDRARETIRQADITLLVVDGTLGLSEEDAAVLSSGQPGRVLVVINKTDLTVRSGLTDEIALLAAGMAVVEISALTGEGIDDLEKVLVDMVTKGGGINIEPAMVANARHESCLGEAAAAVKRALSALEADVPYDLTSIDIREAADALGSITGETASEEIISAIFSRFCIGK